MESVDRAKMLHHRSRSDGFLQAMRVLAVNLEAHGNAVALLAVHAAISLGDAVMLACTGRRSKDQDHLAAVDALRRLCASRGIDPAGLNHLSWLVARKTVFAYGDKRLDLNDDVRRAQLNVERFATWAYKHFKEIARAGRSHD
jgi:hypothetical protein